MVKNTNDSNNSNIIVTNMVRVERHCTPRRIHASAPAIALYGVQFFCLGPLLSAPTCKPPRLVPDSRDGLGSPLV